VEDNEGELAQCVETRCGQRGSLLRERRETLCPLEAGRDQVGLVVPCEVEGKSAVDGCMRSLGGIETPGALEVARIPSVSVPVCAVKGVSETPCVEATPCVSGVFASVPECVLPSTPCVKGAPQAEEAAETARVCEARCVSETPRVSAPAGVSGVVCVSEARRVSERPCERRTACVRSLFVREMMVTMREHAAASPGVNGSLMECSMSLLTRWSLSERMRRRRRLRPWRDKSRVAAVVALGTVPGLHGSERAVRAVQRTRPPRARLRE